MLSSTHVGRREGRRRDAAQFYENYIVITRQLGSNCAPHTAARTTLSRPVSVGNLYKVNTGKEFFAMRKLLIPLLLQLWTFF